MKSFLKMVLAAFVGVILATIFSVLFYTCTFLGVVASMLNGMSDGISETGPLILRVRTSLAFVTLGSSEDIEATTPRKVQV